MPYYVVQRLMDALNTQKQGACRRSCPAAGVAYKADIDDMRESPAIRIAELLQDKGADLVYHDPFVPDASRCDGTDIPRVELTADEVLVGRCGPRS